MNFILADELKKIYDVYGHFYNLKLSNSILKCRSVLEIKRKDNLTEIPDIVVIMMNPGSSVPLDKSYEPETFSKEENKAVIDFIKSLNINHHKVVLTTRSATFVTGEEIKTNELSEEETKKFLIEATQIELPDYNIKHLVRELDAENNSQRIHEITSGRPLFIFQFVILYLKMKTENKEKDLFNKLSRYCAYQERAISEVISKMFDLEIHVNDQLDFLLQLYLTVRTKKPFRKKILIYENKE